MFSKLEFFIALRYLKSKRKEKLISIIAIFSFIGITIGVATLIVVMSVMNGFRYELVNRILGINAHLSVYSRYGQISNYQELMKKIEQIKGVKYVNPIVESQVMLSANNKNIGGLAKGILVADLKNKKLIADNVSYGSIEKLSDLNSIIIGSAIADNLNLNIGDKIKLISAETNKTIIGAIPRIKTYQVAGIYESGMYEYDSSTVFLSFKMAQIHFRLPEAASAIEIFVNDAGNMGELNHQLKSLLADHHDLYLLDWQQSNAAFLDALKIERNVMFLILALIILVAAFNIISSMIMLVNDKSKNIALLRSLGMSKSAIMRIFLICGFAIGAVGTMLGLVIGLLFAANIDNIKTFLESLTGSNLFNPTIYFLSTLPSKIFVSDVMVIVLMSLILSFLATLYPAYKASKSNPADILRYE